jgi:uroporphyrinogen-III synthase
VNNRLPLFVLVTRPKPAGEELSHLIRCQGDEALYLPTIAIAPPYDRDTLSQAIESLNSQDWLIFISPQAVYSLTATISSIWPRLPSHLSLAAIGAGTAKALQEAGYVVAASPAKEWNSEGLLALPEFQTVATKNIAIIKGEGGRDYLEKVLMARGAHISTIITYRRALPDIDLHSYHELFQHKKIDVIVCTSGEGIQNLKTLFAKTDWSYLKNIPVIVVSERMKMLAHDLDFQTIWLARNASHEAIFEILEERRNELCQTKQMKS